MQGQQAPCEQNLNIRNVFSPELTCTLSRPESQEFAGSEKLDSVVAASSGFVQLEASGSPLCAVHWGMFRGEQALQSGGEVCKRLSGADACIHVWRQAVDLVAAQQDDRNIWTNRLQASRHFEAGLVSARRWSTTAAIGCRMKSSAIACIGLLVLTTS